MGKFLRKTKKVARPKKEVGKESQLEEVEKENRLEEAENENPLAETGEENWLEGELYLTGADRALIDKAELGLDRINKFAENQAKRRKIVKEMASCIAVSKSVSKIEVNSKIYSAESLFSSQEFIMLLTGIGLNGKIKSLNLANNHDLFCVTNEWRLEGLGNFIFSVFIRTLQDNPGLEYLNLSTTGICDISIPAIIKGLSLLPNLRYLDLSFNSISTPGSWVALMNYITESGSLKEVNISGMHNPFDMSASLFIKNVGRIISIRQDLTLKVFNKQHQFAPEAEKGLSKLAQVRSEKYYGGVQEKLFKTFSDALNSLAVAVNLKKAPIRKFPLLTKELTKLVIGYTLPTEEEATIITIIGDSTFDPFGLESLGSVIMMDD